MPIQVLPPDVAARIAAGEVIERPASVVKELVENSLDAGASAVEVEVRRGGIASIRVTDNGCGIPPDEAPLAFLRHATSKLRDVGDLARIATLGFRGEALASVAAAASVRLLTRTAGAEVGVELELEGGAVAAQRPAACAQGTVIEVEGLFSTIPARLKFLRSPSAEAARVRQTVDHMAMANPGVRFSFKSDGKTQLAASGNGSLRDVVAAVHGAEVASAMIEVASAAGPYPVWGLVSAPEHSRANRTGLSLFINNRWVQSRAVNAAIEEAYRGLLMEGRFPIAVVFVDPPQDEVDVNVHPNKREVRLSRESDAFTSVRRAVRDALLEAFPIAEARDLGAETAPLPPPSWASPLWAPPVPAPSAGGGAPPGDSLALWAPLPSPNGGGEEPPPAEPAPAASSLSALRMLGQIANTYIVAEGPGGMYLIDQHAAHESVLYYRLLHAWERRAPDVQPMLEPLPIELTSEQVEIVDDARAVLERYGLILEPFGGVSWLVRATPAMARRVDIARLVEEALDGFRASSDGTDTHHAVAASIACHSAVRAGQTLDPQEMAALADALATESNPQYCPHGRPVVVRVSTGSLERQFGRA